MSAALAAGLVAVGLTGCGSSHQASLTMPLFHGSCAGSGAGTTLGNVTVPVKVVRTSSWGALVTAGVCIGNQGPYTFLVDSGASLSVIDDSVATDYRHGSLGSTATCNKFDGLAHLPELAIGGRTVSDQEVGVADVSQIATNLSGILGADVLSRYGYVRFDYRAQTLTVGAQTPPLGDRPGSSGLRGVPQPFRAGVRVGVPMQVTTEKVPKSQNEEFVRQMVSVRIDGEPQTLLVDTGAGHGVLSPALAAGHEAEKEDVPTVQVALGLGCHENATRYLLSSLQVGPDRLRDVDVVSNPLPAGLTGLLGSGVLAHLSPVVLDYRQGRLLLGRPVG